MDYGHKPRTPPKAPEPDFNESNTNPDSTDFKNIHPEKSSFSSKKKLPTANEPNRSDDINPIKSPPPLPKRGVRVRVRVRIVEIGNQLNKYRDTGVLKRDLKSTFRKVLSAASRIFHKVRKKVIDLFGKLGRLLNPRKKRREKTDMQIFSSAGHIFDNTSFSSKEIQIDKFLREISSIVNTVKNTRKRRDALINVYKIKNILESLVKINASQYTEMSEMLRSISPTLSNDSARRIKLLQEVMAEFQQE